MLAMVADIAHNHIVRFHSTSTSYIVVIFAAIMYKLLRNILFWFDAEKVHYFSMNFLKFFCKFSFIKKFFKIHLRLIVEILERNFFGLIIFKPGWACSGI